MSRQVQWRRFAFFDKETVAEDVATEIGAEVSCMHTAGGRLYLGDAAGKVTISDSNLSGKIQRQAYSGPILALALAPDGVPPGSATARAAAPLPSNLPSSSGTNSSTAASNKTSRKYGVVVTLGDDSVNPPPQAEAGGAGGVGAGNGRSPCVLKFWAGADMGLCIRAVDVAAQMPDGQHQRWASSGGGAGGARARLPRLTAFAITPDASQVACGFSDGMALLLQGDLVRSPVLPPPPPLLIQPGEENPSAVTALHFSKGQQRGRGGGSGSSSPPQPKLIVGYDLDKEGGNGGMPSPDFPSLGLLSYDTRTDAEPLVLDEQGCQEGCSAFGQSTQEMVVGREDGVFFFSSEDRGGAAGFEGKKQHVGCLWNYILVVSEDGRSGRHTINMYDMRNKLVAFHALLPQGQGVKRISCQGERYDPNAGTNLGNGAGNVVAGNGSVGGSGEGLAFILTNRNSLLRLRERDTSSKLELLFRKNLYPMAISLAYASDHDVSEILGIYRMHGDHLYKKGDFEGAMQQYQCTIGQLDPSYVIRRFLDAQRIGLLTSYLEALHDAGQASSEHTTLLLNCHTKLKVLDVEKLDRFIHPSGDTTTPQQQQQQQQVRGSTSAAASTALSHRLGGAGDGGSSGAAGANFDVATAIRVLKSAGHADHAAELARRHGEHDWFLRIQLERSQPDFSGALAYIASLPFSEASKQLRRRGKPLVAALPEDTTGVLMALCTGRYSSMPDPATAAAGGGGGGGGNPNSKDKASPTTAKAAAEDFVHLYVDEPRWLRIFLTYVLREGGRAGPTVADTLLELLLREWAAAGSGQRGGSSGGGLAVKKQREDEVMALLDNPRAGYDADHALVLVQMLNFKPGQLYLYEKLYMTELVLEHYVDTGDTRNMIRVCRKEGNNNPDLWVQVLSYLVNNVPSSGDIQESSPLPDNAGDGNPAGGKSEDGGGGGGDVSSDDGEGAGGEEGRWDDVRELLALMERDQVLSPLQVVSILSQNSQLPLWVTRDFLPRYLSTSAAAAAADAAAASELRESTNKMRAEIQGLRATVQSSSSSGSRVAMELPTFMASELEKGGSKTLSSSGLGGLGGEQAKIHDIKAAQARSALDHEQFFKGLEEAADGFGQVASYFGKGVMSMS
ncbi:conserved unknown protein [Ectocarpus siliculosus]|uniref:Uncharacterized protein n=1 Tax=Ectocarpus siliculosus TaxID=2880 RepID=D8LC21_ECTSI|nr:conserved unknown protein [Ectocarpus siliculosus]|eukprot:CBN79204.1 conserved unknown protein [Ectocarpus siliculosus]